MNATPLARLALALAYPVLAHLASLRDDPSLAAIALGDLAVFVLLEPLLRRRAWAWIVLAATIVGLVTVAGSPYLHLVLLLVPALFVALVAWTFGRTLRAGHVPLITRMVSAIDGVPVAQLDADLRAYARALTATWAAVLSGLAVCNFLLALVAVPGGLLHSLGITPPVTVSERAWSWFANLLNYGLVGGLFVGEYFYRVRRFPGRYTSFFDFVRKMAGLGPTVWRGLLHDEPRRS
ncbi:Ketosynthase [Lysobacter dokdonensis DS-58]|uniref:Ketosynthase n=1 Tax=Lysobacter dokdonensis DS-58 TaxID=1300345 RepID=A0A0A2WH50_9GAMM|nr:hypothetical protein [Lysobacter dokdonensis]KGQ19093.1 Ketosynthase [Lysobacter dokdonensis DS-58]